MIEFQTEKITRDITRITAPLGEFMYLVEGSERAALIDTGSGFGSLKAVTDRLTDKPIIVLISHGHTDHAMGSAEFENVCMPLTDEYIYVPHGDREFRMKAIAQSPIKDDFTNSDYIETAPLSHYRDLKEGDNFDLGGINIDIYACPGHTKGSLVMLIRELRILFTGDACNDATFLFEDYSLTVREYRKSLAALSEKLAGKFDRVLTSHHSGEVEKSVIEGVMRVCDEILTCRTDDIPLPFHDTVGFVAKAMKVPEMHRIDGGVGNIIYSGKEKMEILLERAQAGDPHAEAFLGNGYLNGQVGHTDMAQAKKWSRLAAEHGDPLGMMNLGIILEDSDPEKSFSLYKQSADKGYFKAFRYLGLCYRDGVGTTRNEKKAVEYFRIGAEKSDITSQYLLGECYEKGMGVSRDMESALFWYRKSAERGDRASQPAIDALKRLNQY